MYIFPRGGREAGISVDLCVLCSRRCDTEVRVAGTRDHRGRTRVPSLLRPSFPDPQDAGAEHCLSRLLSGCRCGGETQPGASAGSAKGPWARDGRPSRAPADPGCGACGPGGCRAGGTHLQGRAAGGTASRTRPPSRFRWALQPRPGAVTAARVYSPGQESWPEPLPIWGPTEAPARLPQPGAMRPLTRGRESPRRSLRFPSPRRRPTLP